MRKFVLEPTSFYRNILIMNIFQAGKELAGKVRPEVNFRCIDTCHILIILLVLDQLEG